MIARRRSRRERLAFRLPAALMEYPFEVFVTGAAAFIGTVLLSGLSRPSSLVHLLPQYGVAVWSAGLVLGAITTGWGLSRRRLSLITAGLRLVSGLFLVYALAIVGFAGFHDGGPACVLYVFVGALGFFRAFYLTALADIGRRIHEEA